MTGSVTITEKTPAIHNKDVSEGRCHEI